jgi:DNA (cytosine-5)-methyltransferase 1
MDCVELFSGAGGLAMGVSLAGFDPKVVIEWDKWACETIRENQKHFYPIVSDWDVREGDVRVFNWDNILSPIDLVAGGPPCQPFSMGGKHKAYDDSRDMFPATVDIIRQLKPKAFIVENVKGLTRSAFANYYQYILLQLNYPEIGLRRKEDWYDHFQRLQKFKTSLRSKRSILNYDVLPTLVNAADYGVPQKRERVFIVGFRSDLNIEWSFPRPTHSFDALLFDQWITGVYWERHSLPKPTMPEKILARVKFLQGQLPPTTLPWRTVRDAISNLPDPRSTAAESIKNHRYQPGARAYPGHTGSPLDLPAKTLKAGDHGVPGGENMLVNDDGSVRYFTIRESARLQTFPDGYRFHGSWTETMRQLGNAVPVKLAQVVAKSIAKKLLLVESSNLASSSHKFKESA